MIRPRVRIVGGVCAGLAQNTGLPVALVRSIIVMLSAAGGAGVALYAWLWATTPTADGSIPHRRAGQILQPPAPGVEASPGSLGDAAVGSSSPERSAWTRLPITEILLGFALLSIGFALFARGIGIDVSLAVVVPLVVVSAGVGLSWRQFGSAAQGGSNSFIRGLGALILVALGILLFFVTIENLNVWTVVMAAFAVLLGVAVVVAPWLVRLNRDLLDERAARVRDIERAEIASHLHDSVLQSLALIQQKSDVHSDVARIARAQERELREWLFGRDKNFATGANSSSSRKTGASNTDAYNTNIADQIRRIAIAIEADHAARFDVVVVGASPDGGYETLVAAARESMLNAARHAGGTVSVFLEAGPKLIEISVVDRGSGFDLDDIPEDRQGVRESILGRMDRAGGTARISRGPGGVGTEIRLQQPLHPSTKTEERNPS